MIQEHYAMFSEDLLTVTFHEQQVLGQYVIFRTRDENWLVHRMTSEG